MDGMGTGDESKSEGFDELFAAQFTMVARTVAYIVQDRMRAEEIAQDAFVRLLQHWPKVSRYDRPDLWVRKVAVREAVRDRNRTKRRAVLERANLTLEAEDLIGVAARHADVMAAVRRLAPKQRAVVVLFYFEDRPMDEIAHILGCTSSTAWSQLQSARKHLATWLSKEVTGDVS